MKPLDVLRELVASIKMASCKQCIQSDAAMCHQHHPRFEKALRQAQETIRIELKKAGEKPS